MSTSGKYVVYELIKPEDNIPFYIGMTSRPSGRLASHRQFFGNNIKMNILLSDLDSEEFALIKEREIIIQYLDLGITLRNKKIVGLRRIVESKVNILIDSNNETKKPTNIMLSPKAKKIGEKKARKLGISLSSFIGLCIESDNAE